MRDAAFALSAATWRTGHNIHVVFDPGPLSPLYVVVVVVVVVVERTN